MKVLAIVRSKNYVLFSIDYLIKEHQIEGSNIFPETPINITMENIREKNLLNVLKSMSINPRKFFYALGEIMLDWHKHQRALLDITASVAELVEIENLMLEAKNT